jgi:hypothetical protein
MVNRLIDLIAAKPTLMMGLSAQDANIQAIFAEAEARMAWPWPGDRPSCVFSENAIGGRPNSRVTRGHLNQSIGSLASISSSKRP